MAKTFWVAAYFELATPAIKEEGGKFILKGPAAKIYE